MGCAAPPPTHLCACRECGTCTRGWGEHSLHFGDSGMCLRFRPSVQKRLAITVLERVQRKAPPNDPAGSIAFVRTFHAWSSWTSLTWLELCGSPACLDWGKLPCSYLPPPTFMHRSHWTLAGWKRSIDGQHLQGIDERIWRCEINTVVAAILLLASPRILPT